MSIHILTTGGTIASKITEDGSVQARVEGTAIASSAGLSSRGEGIHIHEFSVEGSYNFTFDFLTRLLQRIEGLISQPDCDGIVVTQGTDTIEETAFATYLMNASNVPVVFTGAQRAADTPDGDGPRNLRHAVLAAQSLDLRGERSLVVFGSQVLSGLWAVKRHTINLQPYEGVGGILGSFDETDNLKIFQNSRASLRSDLLDNRWTPDVIVIPMMLGLTEELAVRMVEGARGVVLEGFGIGNANVSVMRVVEMLNKQNVPVVVTSRCGAGPTRAVYGNGGGVDLHRNGAIFAGYLPTTKARLLLSLLLGNNVSRDDMRAWFVRFH